jgi:hypothetical protein
MKIVRNRARHEMLSLYAPELHLSGMQRFRFEVSLDAECPRIGQMRPESPGR